MRLLGWQNYEKREDFTGAWSTRYDISQEYDKVGNRTRFDKNVVGGYTSSYGESMDLSYTYDVRNNLSAINDADDANYTAVVTTDANMNITEIDEQVDTGMGANHLYSYFDVDDLNRVTASRTKRYISAAGKWQWLKREHGYDAAGRLINTTLKQWYDGTSEPAGDSLEHIYDRSKMLQNYDGSSTYGDEWRWAGSQNSHSSPLKSPNADTASQTGYNLANDKTPQRRTYLNPSTQGNQRNLYGQGKPQAKDSSGNGANWDTGIASDPSISTPYAVNSRLFFEGTVTATDMSRATDTREKGRIGITGSSQAYGGSNGRVTSEAIGRDVNPLGRGGGAALVGGMMNEGRLAPNLPGSRGEVNQGNSVNNNCVGCGTDTPYEEPPKKDPPGDGVDPCDHERESFRACHDCCVQKYATNLEALTECAEKCHERFLKDGSEDDGGGIEVEPKKGRACDEVRDERCCCSDRAKSNARSWLWYCVGTGIPICWWACVIGCKEAAAGGGITYGACMVACMAICLLILWVNCCASSLIVLVTTEPKNKGCGMGPTCYCLPGCWCASPGKPA